MLTMEQEFLSNTLGGYVWLVSWIIGGFVFRNILAKITINFFTRTFRKVLHGVESGEFHRLMRKPLRGLIFIITLYISFQYVDFPESWNIASGEEFGLRQFISLAYGVFFGAQITFLILRVVDCIGLIIAGKYEIKEENEEIAPVTQIIPFAIDFVKFLIIIFSTFLILSVVFNINIGTLVAGLGIGGLAVALAAKETFENLLGSFIIYLDKPFEIGDFIKVNDTFFTVEKVGFRSTRLRTLEMTRMTMPNKLLIESNIDNYTLRSARRVDRRLPLSRLTTFSQANKIIEEIKLAINDHPLTTEDIYVNFHEISNYALEVRIQYYVNTKEWLIYLGVVEEVNFKILQIIEENSAEVAYPTTLINVNKTIEREEGK